MVFMDELFCLKFVEFFFKIYGKDIFIVVKNLIYSESFVKSFD